MKKFNKVTKVCAFTIIACLILSMLVPFANAEEKGKVTIEKIDNGNLLFHDCNEEIGQNYYTPEDYEKIDYPFLSDEWENIFQAEHHERIEGTNNIEIIEKRNNSEYIRPDATDSENTDDENDIMPKVFDIKRYVDSKLISTTFLDGGYYTVIKVDDHIAKLVEEEGDTNGISCDIKGEFVSNGNYVKVSYIIKNNNSNSNKISLGTFSDIQIGTADDATVRRQADGSGIVMTDESTGLQFKFFGRNVADVTNVDTLWVGAYPFHIVNFFNNNNVSEFSKYDSAFAYSWQNRTIGAGETQVYSVLLGVDEVSAIPVVSLDKGQERYTSDNAEVSGKVTDLNKEETGKIYFNVENRNQIYLGKYQLNNGAYNFSIDLSKLDLEDGVYKVKVWAIDETGLISSVSEKSIVIGTNTPIPEPEPEPEPEQPKVENKVENKTVNNIISNSNRVVKNNTVNNTIVDNTMASKALPYTGFGQKIGVAIFVLLILARVIYVKYKKVNF